MRLGAEKIRQLVRAIALAAVLPFTANATVIDFDGLSNGEVVTSQFNDITFLSPTPGHDIRVFGYNGGNSAPNIICTFTLVGDSCSGDIIVEFAGLVSELSFLSVGDQGLDNSFVVGMVDVFSGRALVGTVNVLSDGLNNTAERVDLTAFSSVSSIWIRDITDPGGLGFDDFSFVAQEVLEPRVLAIVLFGLTIVWPMTRLSRCFLRRRKADQ